MPTTTPDPLPHFFTAGSLSLLSGASGVGKTAFIAMLARTFHEGGQIGGHVATRSLVGYILGIAAGRSPASGSIAWASPRLPSTRLSTTARSTS
jgi:hypothetical protein